MDIDLLSKMVKELILDHDKVALPGVGSFVAEMLPASFSDKGYTINPPYRRLGFRQHLEEDDLLAELYSSSNGISEEDASKILRDFLSEMKRLLFTKKVIVFPELGRLRATKENNIFFVADESLDIFPEGIGLDPLSLKNHNASSLTSRITELAETISNPAGRGSAPIDKDDEPASEDVTLGCTDNEPASQNTVPIDRSSEPVSQDTAPASTNNESAGQDAVTASRGVAPANQDTAPVNQNQGEEPVNQNITSKSESCGVSEPAGKVEESSELETASDATASCSQASPIDGKAEEVKDDKEGKHKKALFIIGIVLLSLLVLLLVAALLFFIGMTWFPDLLDHLLYSKEELEIIHYWN